MASVSSCPPAPRDHSGFTIAVICALPLEAECVYDVLDHVWKDKRYANASHDYNAYTLGVIGDHNVVVVHMPGMGTVRAAYATSDLKMSFPNIELALVVGVCGGMPYGPDHEDIYLGDVVIAKSLIQYTFGKQYPHGFQRKTDALDTAGAPSEKILGRIAKLRTRQYMQELQITTTTYLQAIQQKSSNTQYPGIENDILYHSSYVHQHRLPNTCDYCKDGDKICKVAVESSCEDLGCESVIGVARQRSDGLTTKQPTIHIGVMGSGDTVIKSGQHRDALAQHEGIMAVEMEGAGVWRYSPSIIIKGVCDYADSHKRKSWQWYAAAAAAACVKAFLMEWTSEGRQSNSDRDFSKESLMLQSDSIFLQERLLIRADIESLLAKVLSCNERVRIVLHGLPGVGKSTVARSFAYNAQKDIAILWIPCYAEVAIEQAFERYARQMNGSDQQCSESIPFIARQLSEHFSDRWLVVFDGLDLPAINIQQYLFADLSKYKILITTRNMNLSSHIKATLSVQINPLNEQLGQDLLDLYIETDSASLFASRGIQTGQTSLETDARIRIVRELGGLPLAIAIVGAALRKQSGSPSISSSAYLTWPDEVKGTLLEQDPAFSEYSQSVWKAFQFAFQGILQGTGINRYAKLMACFTASCENASILTEYIRLYRKSGSGNRPSFRSAATPGNRFIHQLHFLRTGGLELAIRALAAVNMVTVNWTEGGLDSVPHVEMHSLVRRWLVGINHDEVSIYVGPKMWLLGFGMYQELNDSRIGAPRLMPLLKEASALLVECPRMIEDSQIPSTEFVFPLLLDAQFNLVKSTKFLPVGSARQNRLSTFSRELESEITNSYHDTLEDVDWSSIFNNWARELGEQVEYAVKCDSRRNEYMLTDFFLNTLDSHGCIPIAFNCEAPYELKYVGRTDITREIQDNITTQIECSLEEHLDQEAFRQLQDIPSDDVRTFIHNWSKDWEDDVTQIVRHCLAEVVAQLPLTTDDRLLVTEHSSPLIHVAGTESQSFGDYMQSLLNPSDPTNVFFVVLRRTVKAATKRFLDSFPLADSLNAQKSAFELICDCAVRRGFGDRAVDVFVPQPSSSEAGTNSIFSTLWQLAWPGRFPGDLENLIAAKTFNAISNDLKECVKRGLTNIFEKYFDDVPSFAEELGDAIFSASAMCNVFPNWILSGWIDPLSDDEDAIDEEPIYVGLIRDFKQQSMSAMKSIYEDRVNVVGKNTAIQALKSALHCRKAIHDEVMNKLNQPDLTDRTALGPFFAKMCFEDCDKSLRLACSILQQGASEDFVGDLDHLIHVENSWNLSQA